MKTVGQLGEFGLIRQLARHLPTRRATVGPGDDCAVLPSGLKGQCLLFTCDPVVENVHYLPQTPARQVGWKAMARNLSDIAAMGGRPRWAVVSLGLRPTTPVRYVTELYRGLRAAAAPFACEIVGGDTTHVQHEQFIVVTMLGEVERHRLALRRGAQPGDVVFVTGHLGGSRRGKHLRFTPRITEARWLTQHAPVTAMMDLSDGLASDLQRLVEANHRRVGFDIRAHTVPRHQRVSLHAALTDGEDFELLLTVPARAAATLPRRWSRQFTLPLTPIGQVVPGGRVTLIQPSGQRRPLRAGGYDHFLHH